MTVMSDLTFEPFQARTSKDGGSPAASGLPLALQTHAQCVRLASILTLAKTVTVTDIRKAIFQGLQENAKVCVFGLIPVPYPPHSRLGIGPDGKPLPQPNKKRIHPRMYPVLVVNQDGSTYTIRHRSSPLFPSPHIPFRHSPVPQDPTPDPGTAAGPRDTDPGGERGEREGETSGQGEGLRGRRCGGG